MPSTVEVVVGVVGRPHGLRGEIAIDLRTDEPERRFAAGQVVRSEDGRMSLTVESARDHSGRLLVTFTELPDRSAVEAVRGMRLVVDVDSAETPSDTAEFYDRQLVGLRVLDAAGTDVGHVGAVIHLPAQDTLEVVTDGGSRLVPFVLDLVPDVDLEGGFVRLADVPGLLADEDE
ncbi:MAG: ribosome maturation factor RimM [Propionibacteriaceae bacterium]|nr:ribosome maturation factor RimM [Propionibacteriaceae bacterium]